MQYSYLIEAAVLAASQAKDEGFNETSAALMELARDLYRTPEVIDLDVLLGASIEKS